MENIETRKTDPITAAIFDALATGEKCICDLKEAIGIPQTWESYDLLMLEDLKAIDSRTVNGYKHYKLAPTRSLWYVRRSMAADEPETVTARPPVRYDSALEHLRQTMPRVSELEAALRRGC
ncbi:MAG TPA: helix-turn-helix domain-containing protein [Methanocella sp.]